MAIEQATAHLTTVTCSNALLQRRVRSQVGLCSEIGLITKGRHQRNNLLADDFWQARIMNSPADSPHTYQLQGKKERMSLIHTAANGHKKVQARRMKFISIKRAVRTELPICLEIRLVR